MIRSIIKPHPFWYRIIITLSAALSFLFLMWFVLIIRSRRRHNNMLRIAKMAQMTSASGYRDLRYLYGDAASRRLTFGNARCVKIAQNSLAIMEYRLDPPFNSERDIIAYGFLPGVCHDMRHQAVIYHEELLQILAKAAELNGKVNSMTLHKIFAFLKEKYAKRFTVTEPRQHEGSTSHAALRSHESDGRQTDEVRVIPVSPSMKAMDVVSPALSHLRAEKLGKQREPHMPIDKLAKLCAIHEKIRFGPPRMAISRQEWMYYADGMEEVIHMTRACVQ